ncbi:MAG: NAD(P) transhydrogenase subunit alpha [Bacillota bacterium]|jgi:NAD(P) transhydrogenase subunit alpha|nr:NAD(P) transhydrogenase subunit alpha [Bacillota bacterium]HOC05681.1 NAD(P) transhydrogenase subunit alpha [Bacillota bacterium]HPZ22475.1 NAD(P) transhydrogenase subunit alpha [Bacillota bacterium]HQD19238.1 NAD(P) transhydrogenase subunit alpha [Bacillota bacterium]
MSPLILVGIFIVATLLGYSIIKTVPSLLHTPLMSGMNALSGITVLGALTTVALLVRESRPVLASIVGGLAIVLAMINVAGGFGVTHRMLRMFDKGDRK